MTKRLLSLGWASILALASLGAHAQTPVALGTGTSYSQNFDALGSSGLPTGFGVYTAASSTSLGTAATPILTPGATTTWASTGAGFKNFASAAVGSGTSTTAQAAATNRALGVRQTSATGYDPGASFVFKAANTTGRIGFSLAFKLQSLDASSGRTTTWTVDYAVGNSTTFTPVATGTTGAFFANNSITADFGLGLNNSSDPITIRITALDASSGSGNRASSAIDDFTLSWNQSTTPLLTPVPSALAFSSTAIGNVSDAKTYSLNAFNITSPTTLTVTGDFLISKDGTAYSKSLVYQASELTSAATVYVQFVPTTVGPATGSIANSNAAAATKTVSLSGTGYDLNNTNFSFDNCTGTAELSDGWKQYNVTGAQVWACTAFGHDKTDASGVASAPNGVQMNGYANSVNNTNEDWLISPSLNLAGTTYPLFSFWSRTAFNGDPLRLLISTNYSGTGDPNAPGVTWTDLNATFPAQGSDRWTQTSNIDLTGYKPSRVYVAFVYKSTIDDGARWTIDDVVLTNSATPAPPAVRTSNTDVSFGYQPVGTAAVQSLNVTGTNLTGDLTLTASAGVFQLSKDGTTFGSSIAYTAAEASGNTVTPQVRFLPTTASTTYNSSLSISSPSVTPITVSLSGNSYDVANTLEVVNWNMEWFGSDPASGLGPKDKDLQNANATKIINALKADVYALVEVVDTMRLRNIVAGMPGYAYRVGDFGSYADNRQDPDYAGAQKLAFVYRTSVVSNPKFSVPFRSAQADGKADFTYWSSGRFPFQMTADVTLNGVTKPVTFVAIHAKANTSPTATAYDRRKNSADELKAYLDANYAGTNVIVLGDFNDDLDQTITTGLATTVTSYSAFTNDAANYPSPTLQELSLTGKKSTVSYSDVIDHVVTTKSFYSYYIKGTTEVQTSIAATVPNYGNTTSDHYPVLTRYSFDAPDLTIYTANQTVAGGTYNNVTVTGTGSGTLQGPLVVNGTLIIQANGRLDTNCQPITGNGTFTVADGATFGICDAAGIATTGNTGAVQVSGTRSFSPAASYVYNGTAAQVTGAGLPSQVLALTTTNANTLTLTQPLAVAQTLTVAGSGNLALNSQALTLLSTASGTALVVNSSTGAVTGATAAVQRYLDGSLNAGLGYRQLAAPVSGSTVADLTTASFAPVINPGYNTSATPGTVRPYPTVYGYDESRLSTTTNNLPAFDKGWFSPASTSAALTVGKGYTVNLAASQVVDFVGTLNNGDYPQSLTRQNQTNDGGWQLLGNPYPAPLDWSQVATADRSGLDGAVYVSQSTGQYAGTYRSYINGVGNPVLPVGQGFFARITQGTGTASLTLRNSQRVASYATQVSVLRTAAETRPRLNLTLGTPGGSLDGLYVYAEAGATAGFDAQQDAAKLPNTNGLNLAALTTDGQPLSIQALAALTGRVALRVQTPAAGTYTLAAAELLNLPASTTVVLEDALTGQRTPLAAAGAAYSFSVAAGASADGRFWLNLSSASPLATQAGALQTALTLYPNPSHDGQATLLVPTGTAAGQVQVLDALGRLVRQQALTAGGNTTLKLAGLPAGVYIVRVQAGTEQATRRLTLN
ncbi:T9SS-dependent choice-of-anchor J family protein [Hymenobacter cheonanensis]|uniref:T9SS-dependent choice-of-anchor J family protein n=1 Tax=Hymenobacter sp. CA2-7 TaxID=3063993 RepID=UPI002712F25B|nr:choice-of-anchor J domain-containing protein [Hymenobacter sp. CA2-7]MDO7884532.1 choice-of-anchor J domain-containing protein [Hymenobacter sp. CA2-7]